MPAYWVFPLVAAATWLVTLLTMLIYWISKGQPRYRSMDRKQDIAFVSDVGAYRLRTLFIVGSAIAVILFDIALVIEFWLRLRGRLVRYASAAQKAFAGLAILFALVGAAGLILLAVYDTARYPRMHIVYLGVFIGGYTVAAAFFCIVYRGMANTYRPEYSYLRTSFWFRVLFLIASIVLVSGFFIAKSRDNFDLAAILEWSVCLVFIVFVASFALDLFPAVGASEKPFPLPPARV